ncbi:MAG: hypothetical protein MI742_17050 [Desulfobacterales bacterium]|nr:hypothetical protein [Desulfobacterales bacterium]
MSLADQSKYAHNFVSQDQINALLNSEDAPAPQNPANDPLGDIADFIDTDEIDRLLGEEPPHFKEEPMSDDNPEELSSFDEELSMVSMDDIERLLAEEPPPSAEEKPASLDSLSLEEILSDSPIENANGSEEIISQDDIERLLQNSGVSDENQPQEDDDGFHISREEIESLLADTTEEEATPFPETTPHHPEKNLQPEVEESPKPSSHQKPKKILLFAGALLFLLVAGTAAVFLFLKKEQPLPTDLSQKINSATERVLPQQKDMLEPSVTIHLEHFTIPAPQGAKFTLLTTDVVITIRGVEEDPLTGYREFYRKRLFEELTKRIAKSKGAKPVRGELREVVKKIVGTALPQGIIESVVFENYLLQ